MSKFIIIAKNTVPLSNPAGLVIYRYAKVISDIGHECKVYSLESSKNEQLIPEWLIDNDQLYIERVNVQKSNNFVIYLKFIYNLISEIRVSLTNHECVYIITHSNPLYCHWIGIICKLIFNVKIKWIASFTDPYIRSPFNKYSKITLGTIVRKIEQKLAFLFSFRLIFVTDMMREYICKNNKKAISKSLIIPFFYLNEWKSKIQKNIKKSIVSNEIKIIHAGSVYGNRDISKFLASVAKFQSKILFENFGTINNYSKKVADNITINNALSYDIMLEKLNGSDYILVLDSFFNDIRNPYMPSKVVDAMYLDKPIIGITEPDSELDRFLRMTGNISVINDEDAIDNILHSLIKNDMKKFDYCCFSDKEFIKYFDRLNL